MTKLQKDTKTIISEAFVVLLSQKPFDKITIKDIVEECNINRNTFYYYYSDIYDLLEEIFKKELFIMIDDYKKGGSWVEGFIKMLNVSFTHKRIINNICSSRSYDYFETYMYKSCSSIMIDIVSYQAKDMDVPAEDIEFIASFYEYAMVGILSDWFRTGMRETPASLAGQLWLVIDGIKFSLRRSEKRARVEK